MAGALLGWKLEHPNEHRRNQLAVRHVVALDQREVSGGVEAFHDNGGAAETVHAHRPHDRRGVVKGSGGEVDVVFPEADCPQERHNRVGIERDRAAGQLAFDALGSAGGSGRILEEVPLGFVGDRRGRPVHDRAGIGQPSVQLVEESRIAIFGDHQSPFDARDQLEGQLCGHLRQRGAGDQYPCPAVVDDVGRLVDSQMGIDRREIQAGPACSPDDFVVKGVVFHEDGDDITLA